jgi:hypothetical protein
MVNVGGQVPSPEGTRRLPKPRLCVR